MRVGFGYDIHKLVEGRRLLLGGVELPSSLGEDAHSDGDVLIHAVIDAMLGAAGLGDIGSFYPPEDPSFKNISSRILLRDSENSLRKQGLKVVNLDCTVVLEAPKILPYIEAIKDNLAADLGISSGQVSVKGKTKEGLDNTGQGRSLEAYAVVLLEHEDSH